MFCFHPEDPRTQPQFHSLLSLTVHSAFVVMDSLSPPQPERSPDFEEILADGLGDLLPLCDLLPRSLDLDLLSQGGRCGRHPTKGPWVMGGNHRTSRKRIKLTVDSGDHPSFLECVEAETGEVFPVASAAVEFTLDRPTTGLCYLRWKEHPEACSVPFRVLAKAPKDQQRAHKRRRGQVPTVVAREVSTLTARKDGC
jgi:hypothetical protein